VGPGFGRRSKQPERPGWWWFLGSLLGGGGILGISQRFRAASSQYLRRRASFGASGIFGSRSSPWHQPLGGILGGSGVCAGHIVWRQSAHPLVNRACLWVFAAAAFSFFRTKTKELNSWPADHDDQGNGKPESSPFPARLKRRSSGVCPKKVRTSFSDLDRGNRGPA